MWHVGLHPRASMVPAAFAALLRGRGHCLATETAFPDCAAVSSAAFAATNNPLPMNASCVPGALVHFCNCSGEAEAKKDSTIAEAKADEQRMEAKLSNDTEIARWAFSTVFSTQIQPGLRGTMS